MRWDDSKIPEFAKLLAGLCGLRVQAEWIEHDKYWAVYVGPPGGANGMIRRFVWSGKPMTDAQWTAIIEGYRETRPPTL